jgi:hypothetical protein
MLTGENYKVTEIVYKQSNLATQHITYGCPICYTLDLNMEADKYLAVFTELLP